MKLRNSLIILLLANAGAICPLSASIADTETTRVETTTVTKEGEPIVLPTTTTYVLADPLSGVIIGNFEPHQIVDVQTVRPGTVVIDKQTGKLVATINPSGILIDISTAATVDPLLAAIDARRGELNRATTVSLTNGSINAKQAELLRAELDKVGTREAEDTRRGKAMTYAESIFLAAALNDTGDRLAFLAHTPKITPLVGSRFMNIDGVVVLAIDDLDYRRMSLVRRIDDEYVAGRLMFPQVTELKEQLNATAALQADFRKNGELDAQKQQIVAAQLDSLEAKLNSEVASK